MSLLLLLSLLLMLDRLRRLPRMDFVRLETSFSETRRFLLQLLLRGSRRRRRCIRSRY